jgi:hypothetical protein
VLGLLRPRRPPLVGLCGVDGSEVFEAFGSGRLHLLFDRHDGDFSIFEYKRSGRWIQYLTLILYFLSARP